MTRRITADAASSEFGDIINRAVEHNERFLVERDGEPAVLIISVAEYINSLAPTPDWLRETQADAARKGLDKLTMDDIDAEIAAARKARRERHPQSIE